MLAGVSRSAVLEALRAAETPLPIAELASRVDLHPNTVRWHLDQLVEAGWVSCETETRARPGRPRLLYAALAGPPGSADDDRPGHGYRLLADILAGYLAQTDPDPATAATQAGRAWGGYLIDSPAPFARLDADQARGRVTELFDELGFAPEADPTGNGITLHACPFHDVAQSHPDVVCAIHLGLIQGALTELGVEEATARLEPFVTPSECRAYVGPE